MTAIKSIYGVISLCLVCLLPAAATAQLCTDWKEAVQVGELESQLKEASGVALSRQFSGRLYHINDSGDTGRFFMTGMNGKITGTVHVTGFDPVDTEALSLGPCPVRGSGAPRKCLYLGDIGDNDKNRKSIEIVVIEEMQNFPQTVSPRSRLKLQYPDGPHDAESMAVHPDGTIFVLTKERPAKLFKAESNVPEQTLTAVTTLDTGGPPTDMAISDDGSKLLVLTYTDAIEYTMDLKQQHKIPLKFLQQQEGVAYLPQSRSFIYTTERFLALLPQWIMRVDCNSDR